MIYAYIRVSTDKQTVENQRFEINRFAKQRDFQIDVWVEETVSGTRSAKIDGSNEYTECMYVEKCHPAHGEREI